MDTRAIAIPLEERQYGMRVAVLPDRALLASATFILVVQAQMAADSVRSGFPLQVKIGSMEKIRDLVNLQLQGCWPAAFAGSPPAIAVLCGLHVSSNLIAAASIGNC